MIVKKSWSSGKVTGQNFWGHEIYEHEYTGWFLFGIIPLYIIRD